VVQTYAVMHLHHLQYSNIEIKNQLLAMPCIIGNSPMFAPAHSTRS